jgi:peptidoglycan/xylan/chitin deacetylase (PgdA/CDA1 family)
VSPSWPSPLAVTPARFAAQLRLLARRGYLAVTFTELVEAPAGGRQVAITFDDAFASVVEHGLPIMRELGMVGTVFVPTGRLDAERPMRWSGIETWSDSSHGDEVRGLSWDALRSLADEGWEIGSHTVSHALLPALDDTALSDELTRSRARCSEEIGRPCTSIAYPYGLADARVAAATEACGYSAATVLRSSLAGSGRFTYPRVGVFLDDSTPRFALESTRFARRLRESGAWAAIAAYREARGDRIRLREDGSSALNAAPTP